MPFRHWRLAWSALESAVLCFSPLRREWLPAPLWLCSDWWTPGSPQWWTGWVVDLGAPAPLHRLHPDYSTTDVKIDTEIQSNATWRQKKQTPNISPNNSLKTWFNHSVYGTFLLELNTILPLTVCSSWIGFPWGLSASTSMTDDASVLLLPAEAKLSARHSSPSLSACCRNKTAHMQNLLHVWIFFFF